ncbi:MAG: FAD-dependent oxidoreductase [Gordonibacter sp.]|uniref:FAD-dependent oxidoreductase n=1 Tax=Gordonibacter sp. TaxID=1968902 RepID=UPI002FC61669
MQMNFTRRQVVAGAAVLGGTLALGGCASPQKTKQTEAVSGKQADIVVVGSGLSGLACAVSAAENGSSVILVDKAPFLTSTFLTSKGNVSIAQVPENKEAWQFDTEAPDTIDEFEKRYRKQTELGKVNVPYPDYDRMRHMMVESCATIAWVEERTGIAFNKSFTKEMVGTDTVKPEVNADPSKEGGAWVAEGFAKELDRLGVQSMVSTEALELIHEEGTVVGVKVKSKEGDQELRAKAVVLATGGFGGSQAYCDELVPIINEMGLQFLGNTMNTGDSMTMATALGAAVYEGADIIAGAIMPARALTKADTGFQKLCENGMEGAATSSKLLVNAAGERFVNEASPVIALSTAMIDKNNGPYYVLFDSSNAAVAALLEKGISTNNVAKADDIALLAAQIDAPQLVPTFETYQQAAKDGLDATFNKKAEKLMPYGVGPYYAVTFVPSFVATMGGIKTNVDCQVIREDGSTIAGLYAVGETTHRFMYNRNFVRHCSNSSSLTMGRLTGAALAKQ